MDNSNNYADDIESLEELLNFDPFKVNVNRQMLVNEFVTDGSLGLVPFLEMNNEQLNDSSMLFDKSYNAINERKTTNHDDYISHNDSHFWK